MIILKGGGDWITPNVSLITENGKQMKYAKRVKQQTDYSKEYFTIEALEDGLTAKLSVNACEYSLDGNTWNNLSAATNTPAVNTGEKIYFRGNLTPELSRGIGTFTISKKCNLKGNIMSFLYGDNFIGKIDLFGNDFYKLFYNCTNIVDTSELILPATIAKNYSYYCMFQGCTSLTTAPELPATKLWDSCYSAMFDGCTSLTEAPKLPATTVAYSCYSAMFRNCSKLTTAPELPATKLASYCYANMFNKCKNLNYIKMLATNIDNNSFSLNTWVSGVSSTGTFIKHLDANISKGTSGIPTGWTVKNDFTPVECISLIITAEDVSGRDTITIITYTAIINGYDNENNSITVTNTGTVISDPFPYNTSETETVTRTISYTYMGVTATTTITQGIWINSCYAVNLNSNWQLSPTISNPDSILYDGVYESYSNYNVNNGYATMYIDIDDGCETFKLYIRSNAESNYDYVMVSQLDASITGSTSYTNSSLVKAYTRGSQNSGINISSYKLVEFTNIDKGSHRITIVYRKDSSGNAGTDRGYVLIPKNQ